MKGFTVSENVRADFLRYVIIAAVEGGINYWAAVSDYRPSESTVTVYEADAPDDEGVTLTPSDIERALAMFRTGKVRINKKLLGYILVGDALNDAGDIDAECADCIVQVALFGDIVYG